MAASRKNQIIAPSRMVLEHLPCGVVLIDGQGVVEWLNASALDLLQKDWHQSRWLDVIQACFSPQADDGHEVSLRDGRLVKVATSAVPDTAGQIICLTDVTASRAYARMSARRSRLAAIGQMTAQLAHQLRNVLASATLFSNQLADKLSADSRQRQYLQRIDECHASIASQVNDLLSFSRGERMDQETLAVNVIVDRLRQELKHRQSQWEGKFHFSTSIKAGNISVNSEALLGAFNNLLENAIQAGAAVITVTLSDKPPHHWQITVEDDGHGVDKKLLPKLGTPFLTTKSRGTGLGLAVVEAFVEAHKGSLSIESTPGQGTAVMLLMDKNPEDNRK